MISTGHAEYDTITYRIEVLRAVEGEREGQSANSTRDHDLVEASVSGEEVHFVVHALQPYLSTQSR